MILAKEGEVRDFSVDITTNAGDVNSKCKRSSWDRRIALLLSADIGFLAVIAVDVSAGILLVYYELLGETIEWAFLPVCDLFVRAVQIALILFFTFHF
jgi:hypothetical protein